MFGEPALGFNGGGAAHACGRDGLAVNVVGAVARNINPRDVGLHLRAGLRSEIAALIDVEWRSEGTGVRNVADGDEDALMTPADQRSPGEAKEPATAAKAGATAPALSARARAAEAAKAKARMVRKQGFAIGARRLDISSLTVEPKHLESQK